LGTLHHRQHDAAPHPRLGIDHLVGHRGTAVTEIYRKQNRPVVQTGAVTMNRISGRLTPMTAI
jgi:hypothetical protein